MPLSGADAFPAVFLVDPVAPLSRVVMLRGGHDGRADVVMADRFWIAEIDAGAERKYSESDVNMF